MEPRPTVFFVDDDAGMRKSLRMLIQSAGLQTADYPSAETFLADYRRPGPPPSRRPCRRPRSSHPPGRPQVPPR